MTIMLRVDTVAGDWYSRIISHNGRIMTRCKLIFNLVSILFLTILSALIWRTSMLLTDMSAMFTDTKSESALVPDTKTNRHEQVASLNDSTQFTNNLADSSNVGHYETVKETIARIKRDVYVTGSLISTPGEEAALFRIEGMPDRSFSINTQLMDGFIITGITDNRVILKNQTGNEIIFLDVGK